jgi:hypothetical protein
VAGQAGVLGVEQGLEGSGTSFRLSGEPGRIRPGPPQLLGVSVGAGDGCGVMPGPGKLGAVRGGAQRQPGQRASMAAEVVSGD